jgi:hypothetical protein
MLIPTFTACVSAAIAAPDTAEAAIIPAPLISKFRRDGSSPRSSAIFEFPVTAGCISCRNGPVGFSAMIVS